jgi:mRNA deadenylase 3'-5' endonuclease subunit Ccr4
MSAQLSFNLTTYNLLASQWINPDWYPKADPNALQNAEARYARHISHLLSRKPDIAFLQEVEESNLKALQESQLGQLYEFSELGANVVTSAERR